MIFKAVQRVSSILLSTTLLVAGTATEPVGVVPNQASPQTATKAAASNPALAIAPLTPGELDALVAPVALYPDALVAQVLGAAASPDQVAIAAYWQGQNKSLTGTALAQAVDGQSWDPSVKALTQFPSVLNDLAGNLAWTSNLGQAFENQQADVMAAVQRMRAKAQAAGTLQSTPQVQVVQQSPQTIVIQPADPNVVYVPQYNPAVVYGSPYVVPLYTPPVAVVTPRVFFGAGVAIGVGVGLGMGGFGWGFHAWNCNWGGGAGAVFYQHNTYIHNTTYIHNRTTYNNYHPWGPGPHGRGPYGPHPYNPNGFRSNEGKDGRHYAMNGGPEGDRYAMNGGPNGDRGVPDGGRNGDHGQIGGNGGTQHFGGEDRGERSNSFGADRGRSHMSGDGGAARAEHDRGVSSMHHEPYRSAGMRAQGHRGGGGGGRRR